MGILLVIIPTPHIMLLLWLRRVFRGVCGRILRNLGSSSVSASSGPEIKTTAQVFGEGVRLFG